MSIFETVYFQLDETGCYLQARFIGSILDDSMDFEALKTVALVAVAAAVVVLTAVEPVLA